MNPNNISTVELLENNVQTAPKTLLNIGVGPRHNNEASVFKRLWPNIQIIGLEPNIETFRDRIVDYPGKLYPWALWSTPIIKKIMTVRKSPGKSSMFMPHSQWIGKWSYNIGKTCDEVLVSCVTLDQLDKVLNYPVDIFLWMDIEGAELEALRGGCSLLASGRVNWIDMEVSHKPRRINEPSKDSLSVFLQDYGFSIKCQYNCGSHFHNSLYVRKK